MDTMTTSPITVPVERTGDLPLPAYAHPGDAGMDLRAATSTVIAPGGRAIVPAGIKVALPDGYAAFVHSRSGLAAKRGVVVANSPGVVDAHYRGEIGVILMNHGDEPFEVAVGDRIAQLVIQKVEQVTWELVDAVDSDTVRGAGAFGSSGV